MKSTHPWASQRGKEDILSVVRSLDVIVPLKLRLFFQTVRPLPIPSGTTPMPAINTRVAARIAVTGTPIFYIALPKVNASAPNTTKM
ncbi:MAG: hypothetical protein KDI63_15900 [Gammaproteobacteria bacterium]|nr:hypothetical protein [Gammaproteobacteria bacterium]